MIERRTGLAWLVLLLCAGGVLAQDPAPEEPTPAPTEPPIVTAPPPPPVPPVRPAWKDRLYFGGGVGAAFGDTDYVEVAPLVGYRLHPRVRTGLRLFYRWKHDGRFANSVDTSDYGGALFANVDVLRGLFLAAEYEFVEYEYATSSGDTFSDSNTAVLGGVGFSRATRGRGGFFGQALYNFSYDENDPLEPYDDPWLYRVGYTFGF